MHFSPSAIITLCFLSLTSALTTQHLPSLNSAYLHEVPNAPSGRGVQTIVTPQNITIRYKEPGKEGICETTPGVKSYSGYIDLDEDTHAFFWFFEARNNARDAPITLWLNGGPGADSLAGLFMELGPCSVTENLTTVLNPYSWSEVSNLLFLSQPFGVGLSYSDMNATVIGTSDLAAVAAWQVLQGFFGGLPQLGSEVKSREFHLWTESYGGHYGPAFFKHFYDQNQLISNGSISGIELNLASLGIGNGLIDAAIQFPFDPKFAANNTYPKITANNTYGIRPVDDKIIDEMQSRVQSCLDQAATCKANYETERFDISTQDSCVNATIECDSVWDPYFDVLNNRPFDIRPIDRNPEPPQYFAEYMNLGATQDALGVDRHYQIFSQEVVRAFLSSGDRMFPSFLNDLEELLNNGVRVHLYYGDADARCNWFGGEAVSLKLNYTHSAEFAASGYSPFMVGSPTDKYEAGEVRQYENFSFLRVYESGHMVPFYQPEAALEMFRRTVLGLDVATGEVRVGEGFSSNGSAEATHVESFAPWPQSTGVSLVY